MAALGLSMSFLAVVSAAAQSKAADVMPRSSIPSALKIAPTVKLDLGRFNEAPYLSFSPALDQALLPLPPQILAGADITRDFIAIDCIAGQTLCGPQFETVGLNLSKAINTDKPGGIDLQLIPRASFNFGDEHSSALVGAVVKIGEDLREIDQSDNTRWYLFAGADAEALTYSSNNPSRLTRGQFNLQDKIIVGDAQAGFGYKIGDADISLAYIRRDVSSYGRDLGDTAISYTEDAAALSLTWRR
jgi:hypothetical protein